MTGTAQDIIAGVEVLTTIPEWFAAAEPVARINEAKRK